MTPEANLSLPMDRLLALWLIGILGIVGAAEPPHDPIPRGRPAEEALSLLKEGNARFVAGEPLFRHEGAAWRTELESGQKPFAIILGCSDSRVPPELVFDQGFGDLFIIRVAGNVAETDVIASIEYAVDHLGTNLIVVMGHSKCGAVSDAVDHGSIAGGEPAEILRLLADIKPAVTAVPKDLVKEERIQKVVEKNVELSIKRLNETADLEKARKAFPLRVVGAVYDLHTGKVNFLEPTAGK